MSRQSSPSARWSREHGGRRAYRRTGSYPIKRAHSTRAGAWRQSLSLVYRDFVRGYPVVLRLPYPCRWGAHYQDGETAPVHWHVGRRPRLDAPN